MATRIQAASCSVERASIPARSRLQAFCSASAGPLLRGWGQHSSKQDAAGGTGEQTSSRIQPSAASTPAHTAHRAALHGAGSGSGGGNSNGTWFFRGGNDGPEDGSGSSWLQRLTVLVAALAPALLLPGAAAAAAAASKRSSLVSQQDEKQMASSWQLDAFVDRMWDLSGPIMNNMGFSGLLGAFSAAALKWVGRTLAASLGMGLILIQVMSYYNIITVNWSVVHKQARQVLDTTGDGRLDQDDFKRFVKQGLVVLSEGVPSVSGFLVGFLVGLKVF